MHDVCSLLFLHFLSPLLNNFKKLKIFIPVSITVLQLIYYSVIYHINIFSFEIVIKYVFIAKGITNYLHIFRILSYVE